MEAILKQWEAVLQSDDGLNDRLRRLNAAGYPATHRGDLLALRLKGQGSPIVVSWDGKTIHVGRRPAKNPFFAWALDRKKFRDVFLSGKFPPLLVVMNNDQKSIQARCDHHNGAIVLSCMVMLQECTEGGRK